MYEVAAVDTGGLSSERVGLQFNPDANQDGAVTREEYSALVECFGGPDVLPTITTSCLEQLDAAGDGDVDLADFRYFQLVFSMWLP